MKKMSPVFALIMLVAASCSKSNNSITVNPPNIAEDPGCMTRMYSYAGDSSAVKPADYKTALQLLQLVNAGTGNLRITSVIHDTMQNEAYVNIEAQQYVNGLPIFNDDMRFGFKDGVEHSSSGSVVTSCGLDTIAALKATQVRTLFVNLLNSKASAGIFTSYKDSCLVTEFGYYNINANSNVPIVNLVKAWFVHPQNSPLPFAYIKDNGATIEYVTGIVF